MVESAHNSTLVATGCSRPLSHLLPGWNVPVHMRSSLHVCQGLAKSPERWPHGCHLWSPFLHAGEPITTRWKAHLRTQRHSAHPTCSNSTHVLRVSVKNATTLLELAGIFAEYRSHGHEWDLLKGIGPHFGRSPPSLLGNLWVAYGGLSLWTYRTYLHITTRMPKLRGWLCHSHWLDSVSLCALNGPLDFT